MKIIWTDFAIRSLKDIFDYYTENTSKKVADKIRKEILFSTKQLNKHPKSGQEEQHLTALNLGYRYILSGNYKIIYRIDGDKIFVNDVFDTRQNPIKITDESRLDK